MGSTFNFNEFNFEKKQTKKGRHKKKKSHVINSPQKMKIISPSEMNSKEENESDSDYVDCYYDSEVDMETYREKSQEVEEKWEQTLKDLFSERTGHPEWMLEDYKKMQEERNLAIQKIWERNKEKTRISEYGHAYVPNWEEDQERFEIDRKYHENLKKFLGPKGYQKLRQKIDDEYADQIKKARNGDPFVGGIDY